MFSEELKKRLAEQLDEETIQMLMSEITSTLQSQEQKYTSIVRKLTDRCKEIENSNQTLKQIQEQRSKLKQEMSSLETKTRLIETNMQKMKQKQELMQGYEQFIENLELKVGDQLEEADRRKKALDERETSMDEEVEKKAEEMSKTSRERSKAMYEKHAAEKDAEFDDWVDKIRLTVLIIFAYGVAVTLLWGLNSSNFRNDIGRFFAGIVGFATALFRTTWRWAGAVPGPVWMRVISDVILRFIMPASVLAGLGGGVYFAARQYAKYCSDDLSFAVTAALIAALSFGVDVLHHLLPWINTVWLFLIVEGCYLLIRRLIQIHRALYEY